MPTVDTIDSSFLVDFKTRVVKSRNHGVKSRSGNIFFPTFSLSTKESNFHKSDVTAAIYRGAAPRAQHNIVGMRRTELTSVVRTYDQRLQFLTFRRELHDNILRIVTMRILRGVPETVRGAMRM